MKRDITSMDDIKCLVGNFYEKVRADDELKDVFENRIQDRWPEHLEKMVRFWQTVLLDEHTYNGSPFTPHANLPIAKKHFIQWIALFCATVDELFSGEKADRAKWQGQRMAELFQYKIEFINNNSLKPIL